MVQAGDSVTAAKEEKRHKKKKIEKTVVIRSDRKEDFQSMGEEITKDDPANRRKR